MILFFIVLLFVCLGSARAETDFACAGFPFAATDDARSAAKPVQSTRDGPLSALALFAHFRGEMPARGPAPPWADGLFDRDRPGSFSHFYEAMSFGRFRPGGTTAPQRYAARDAAAAYVSDDPGQTGDFGRFVREILAQADRDIDFARFDNDGPDGVPDSGDDDGFVDAVFINTASIPPNFLLGGATGIATLGFDGPFITDDRGDNGSFIRIDPARGTVQRGRTFAEAAGVMCHEYGHLLGLPDLFNKLFLSTGGGPHLDSAGIGNWGLMGWGATGWHGDDGPNPFSAWSRAALGWARIAEPRLTEQEIELADVATSGQIYRIPVGEDESFLLAYRNNSSYYDRHLPGAGLMVWHAGFTGHPLPRFALDLESADGRWGDAGFPLGAEARPHEGEDNLDYWAHDTDYQEERAGNLGDGTDPFDGVRFAAFAPDTNPSARTHGGLDLVRVEDIRIEDGRARARVRLAPARIEVDFMEVLDADGDQALSFGETVQLRPKLVNRGGVPVEDLRVRVRSDSELLEVVRAEMEYGRLAPGRTVPVALERLLRVQLTREPDATQMIELSLDLLVDGEVVGRHDFALAAVKAYRLSGRVSFAEGVSGPRQQVALLVNGIRRVTAETDDEGFYEAEVAPGSYYIAVNIRRQHGLASIALVRQIRGDTRLDFTMNRAHTVTGLVLDEAGNPVVSAVVAPNRLFRSLTQLDGTFTRTDLAPGRYNFWVEKTSADPQRAFPRQFFDVRVGGETAVEFRLRRGARVSVEVVDAEGARVPSAAVRALSPRSSDIAAVDGEGVAQLSLLPGVYSFDLDSLQSPLWGARLSPVRIAADTTLQMRVERGAAISGRLVDEAGAGFLPGQLYLLPRDRGQRVVPELAPDGSYAVRLPPGRYQAGFASAGLRPTPTQSLGPVEVAGDGTLDFHLEPGERLRGQLVDAAGEGIGDVEVQAFSPSGQTAARARTGADGLFEMSLRRGEYEWAAHAPGAEPAITGAPSPVGQGAAFWNLGSALVEPLEGVRLRRPGGAWLEGRVLDDQGRPVAGALVQLTRDPLDPAAIVKPHRLEGFNLYKRGSAFTAAVGTDAEGRFRIEAPPGRYGVLALPGLFGGAGVVAGEVVLPRGAQLDIALPATDEFGQLYGHIAYEPGWPRSEVLLRFYDRRRGVVAAQISDPLSPGYQLDLPPGEYQVRAGLTAPTGGLLKVYELGRVRVGGSRRWDIDLDRVPTAVLEREQAVAAGFALDQNFPNPFNPATLIRYRVAEEAAVELVIYDVLGREVRRLVDKRQRGAHEARWDGRDNLGREVASGVYLYRLAARAERGGWTQSRKLVLIR